MHRHRPPRAGPVVHRWACRGARSDADVICQMDADLSHDPKTCPTARGHGTAPTWSSGRATFPGGSVRELAGPPRLLSAFANWYMRAVTRLPVATAPAASAAGARRCSPACRSTASSPTATRFIVEMAWAARPRLPHRRGADHLRRATEGQSKLSGGSVESPNRRRGAVAAPVAAAADRVRRRPGLIL